MPVSTQRKPAAQRCERSANRAGLPDSPAPEPDLQRALALVMELMAIPGRSGEESAVAQYVVDRLRAAGIPQRHIRFDRAHRRSPLGGSVGSLVCKLPGTQRGPRRLLMAHLDTVPLCVGSQPVLRGRMVQSANKHSGLGADDRSGVAAVLCAALEIAERRLPHPPVTFFWPVQEEVGLFGARFADLALLGRPRLAFNFDGGDSDKITIGATGAYRLTIRVHGLASHAGGAPEHGVSAIAIAALAIARLQRDGWHGDIHRDGKHGTSNVGVIHGGAATNVVTDYVELRAEARSHDRAFRRQIVRAIETAFREAAGEVRNVQGRCGKVQIEKRLDYEAFLLRQDEPCVQAAAAAVRSIGGEPELAVTNGGLDANWMTAHGLPTVTLGCGQLHQHTLAERLDVRRFERACRIALRLATASEGA
jgi:tripeptide aminopeptidase